MQCSTDWLVSLVCLLFVSVLVSGCGGDMKNAESFASADPIPANAEQLATAESSVEPGDWEKADIQRKIIYEATVDLTVTTFDGVPEKVRAMVKSFGGYLSSSHLEGATGERRSGTWTIKIPSDQYPEFLDQAGKLGELQSLREETTEVTAEFYDLEARIRTKEQEETRMLKHLEEDTKELKDILAVEKELMRLRSELERSKGQMRLLTHRTDFSTVTLFIREYRDFEPEQRATFGVEVKRSFQQSINHISEFLRTLAIALVVLAPWLLLLGLPTLLLTFLFRRIFKSKTRK